MGILDGKVAIVTGAGRGIGRGIALLAAKEGAKVIVNDFGGHFDGSGGAKSPADEVVDEIKKNGGEAAPNYESVSDFEGAKRIIQTAVDNYGQLNILINNAGILRDRMVFKMSEEEFDAVFAVHAKGTWNCMRHASAYWRDQHKAGNILNPRIVSMTSDAGLLGNPGQTNYGGAKAAIAAMAVICAGELSRYGVTSNAIAPMARTRLTVDATPQTAEMLGKPVPEGEFDFQHPDNVAPMAIYLASDDAKDVTGRVFRVGGDKVWLFQGWHTVGSISKGKARWEPKELGPKVGEMVKKAPPPEDLTSVFSEILG
ncbi:MAG: SDR family oxidoreductase [Spirochaetota bacterium]|nr:SDR family oxidoreductase [Spirochaetota bacterium]